MMVYDIGIIGCMDIYLIVLGEIVVRDGDSSGSTDDVNEAILTTGEKAVVNPNIRRCKHRNGISIRASTLSNMRWTAPDAARFPDRTVMNADPMNNYMAYPLHRYAWPVRNLHFNPSTVNGLEAVHDKLVLQFDNHVLGENDPKRLRLDYTISQCAWFGVYCVVVRCGDHIYRPIFSSYCIFAEAHRAIRQSTAVGRPV